jgi:hypothetical protein
MSIPVSYTEVRLWARWLSVFTPHDLADSMGVEPELGERFINAMVWQGIVEDTGEVYENGAGRPENVFTYIPPPPGPTSRPRYTPPEVIAGYTEILSPRGITQRLVDNTDRRNAMQGTKGTRLRIKQRDKAYDAMQRAKRERAEKQREKAKIKNAGKPKKKGKKTIRDYMEM